MTSGLLQAQHQARQLFMVQLLAVAELADFEVLAKDTAQVAAAEENRPGAFPAAQAVLFTEMGKGPRHPRAPADLTNTGFIF
jgi:hypothetical protein